MAFLGQLNKDVEVNNNAAGGGSFTLLPDDEYELEITESDVKPSQSGKGQNLDFKVQVVSGPHKGAWFFGGITSIQHESAQAQTIAQGQLKALCMAAGVDFEALQDSKQLEYKAFFARVGSETYFSKKHNKDMTKNMIVKYLWDGMPEDDAAPQPPATKSAPQQAATQQQQSSAPEAGAGRSWQRRT